MELSKKLLLVGLMALVGGTTLVGCGKGKGGGSTASRPPNSQVGFDSFSSGGAPTSSDLGADPVADPAVDPVADPEATEDPALTLGGETQDDGGTVLADAGLAEGRADQYTQELEGIQGELARLAEARQRNARAAARNSGGRARQQELDAQIAAARARAEEAETLREHYAGMTGPAYEPGMIDSYESQLEDLDARIASLEEARRRNARAAARNSSGRARQQELDAQLETARAERARVSTLLAHYRSQIG